MNWIRRLGPIAALITSWSVSACSNGSQNASNAAAGGHPSDASPDSPGWPDTGGAAGAGGTGGASTAGQAGAPGDAASEDPPLLPPTGPAVLVENQIVPNAIDVKLPSIVADDTTVTLAGTTAEQATVWQKLATADAFGTPQQLGAARGQPDYAATSVSLAPDGSLHVVWIDQTDPGSVRYRHRPADGDWGPERQVVGGPGFRPFADVAATSFGTLVVWDQDERLRYSLSTDQGASWSPPAPTVDAPPGSVPDLTGFPNGAPVLVHAWDNIFCERWDGSQFVREVLPKIQENDFYADPSLSIGPDGRLWVAARNVEPRLFLAERSLTGTWTVESPFGEIPIGRVTIVVDTHGGGHLAWAHPAGDPPGLRYAYRPPNGTWQTPVVAPIPHFHNGAWLAVTRTTPMRVHIVTEDFDDTEGLRLRLVVYALD